MRVNRIDNTNFGILKMPPKAEIKHALDKYHAEVAEQARTGLEILAKDVDITVKPISSQNFFNKGFELRVFPLMPSNGDTEAATQKTLDKNFENVFSAVSSDKVPYVSAKVLNPGDSLNETYSQKLVNMAKDLKNELKKRLTELENANKKQQTLARSMENNASTIETMRTKLGMS